MKDLCNLRLPC